MIVNHNINNLSGGVSRQPSESRFDNQVEEMINFVPTISNGLVRRNPLRRLVKLSTTLYDDMPIHSYNRGDGVEKYLMFISDNKLIVTDSAGNQKTVTYAPTTGNPIQDWYNKFGRLKKKDINFLTVGDTTWILNKKMTVKMTLSKTPENSGYYCFYWAKRSWDNGLTGEDNKGYDYSVVLDGTVYTANATSTTQAINKLDTLVTNAGFTVKKFNSIMRISRSTNFTFSSGDSWGDQASKGWIRSVEKVSDLPADIKGFTESEVGIITVTGSDRDNFNSYYLKWTGDFWTETAKEDILDTINPETMPCKLVRNSDGTFTVGYNKDSLGAVDNFNYGWEKRKKGDDDNNPLPSFINNQISSMFFFKNRLCFTSEENVIMSETGEYYNFFSTTVMEVLDSDPIDAGIDSDTVSIIRNVNAVAGSITLWSDNAQFVLSGGEVLSPATTRISKTSSYNCDNNLEPLLLDNEIMFFRRLGNRTDVLSYSPSSINTDKSTAEELSSHCKGYIPRNIANAVTSSANNIVILLDGDNREKLFLYRYFISNNERVMTSWFQWDLGIYINSIEVLGNILYVIVNNNTVCQIDLTERFTGNDFLDYCCEAQNNVKPYTSVVTLSPFNIETRQETRIIREPFYIKNVKLKKQGDVDLLVWNVERNTNKTIKNKHLGRKIFIGGHSEKVYVNFISKYETSCVINAISIEGLMNVRSRNL